MSLTLYMKINFQIRIVSFLHVISINLRSSNNCHLLQLGWLMEINYIIRK